MLQSGKSATMLPSIAASSSGHWNQDGSRRWQRAIRAVGVEPQPDQHVAAEAFDQRHALAGRARRPAASARSGAAGQPVEDLLDQRQALLDLADADPDARIDVALLEHRHLEAQLVVGRIAGRRGARRSRGPRRGRHSRRRRTARASAGVEDAGGDGAILQRGGVVVELDQLGKAPADRRRSASRSAARRPASRSTATPPGTMRSIIRRWPKQASAARSTSLAQDAAVGVHQRERGVVADRADVAEMVGEPLELGHQRAQPDRARRRLDAERRLDGAGEGERIGDGAVARDAAGELRRALERRRRASAPSMPLCT